MSSKRMNGKLRNRLAGRVLAGKITVDAALEALAAAGVPRRGRKAPAAAAKSAPPRQAAPQAPQAPPALHKGYRPAAAGLWTASELAALAPWADSCNPAMRAVADAKMAERQVV